jgi:hypothetical protein
MSIDANLFGDPKRARFGAYRILSIVVHADPE